MGPPLQSKIPVSAVQCTVVHRAIDFICLEMTPYYEGFAVECPIEDSSCIGAANYANAKAEGLAEFYTKDVWVCETGWPTEGNSCCIGIPDETSENQVQTGSLTESQNVAVGHGYTCNCFKLPV